MPKVRHEPSYGVNTCCRVDASPVDVCVHAGVRGADCNQEIDGVCYTCPEGYPNNLLIDGSCRCGKDNGDQVPCVRAAGESVTDSVGSGVTQTVTGGVSSATTFVSFLVVLVVGVLGQLSCM